MEKDFLAVDDYELLDSGEGFKLERFGQIILSRPCAQACWKRQLSPDFWEKNSASFSRKRHEKWQLKNKIPASWIITVAGIKFKLSITEFGHLGIFPEQRQLWQKISALIRNKSTSGKTKLKVLNLFAYSGGATIAAAKAGAEVCHLDASKGMISWARENAALNGLDKAPIRWIVDDVNKFLDREIRRNSKYDAVILDPPTFGRGSKMEVYKIEKNLSQTLEKCRKILSPGPLFILLSCHTPTFTPAILENMLRTCFSDLQGTFSDKGEMLLRGGEKVLPLPSGSFAWWQSAAK